MTTQPAYLTLQSGTSRYLTQTAGTNYYLTLNDPAPYDNDVSLLLAEAAWYIDSHNAAYDGGQTVPNMGTAGTALDAQMGSTTGADTNDPKWLAYEGTPYVYLPGVSGNYLSVPDAAALDLTSNDMTILCHAALTDWTPSADMALVSKYNSAGERSYEIRVEATTGKIIFAWTTDGTTEIKATSTVAPTVTDGSGLWVKVTHDIDNGASQNVVTFYTSTDGASWSALGTAVTTASATTHYNGTSPLRIGSRNATALLLAGKVYRAIVKDGIDGPTVLDVDCSQITSGSATSFSARTGQTVTVNRSTSGRKATLVGGWAGGGSLWLFGTDDYMEVPDDPAIDFGASDSFTVLAVVRQWATQSSFTRILSKASNLDTGYTIVNSSSPTTSVMTRVDDGPDSAAPTADRTLGALTVISGVLDRDAATMTPYANGTAGTAASSSAIGSLTNALPLRVGADAAGASYTDFELVAVAVFRRALTAGEIAGLSSYFRNRAYNG